MEKETSDIQAVKKSNMKRVLAQIRSSSTISRAELAKVTGLTRATISSLVDELIEKRLIEEIGTGLSSGGRKPILLRSGTRRHLAVGIDLSNEHVIRGYLCNMNAEVLTTVEMEYENNQNGIYEAIREIIEGLEASVPAMGKIAGIGIGAAGLVNPGTGEILFSANFNVKGMQLVSDLSKFFSLPVYIENESNAAAWAEMEYGNGRGFRNIIYISKGKGIGSGIIIDGSIYYGGFFGAGEVGHIMVDPNGEKCRCGAKGCLEVFASQSRVLGKLRKVKNEGFSLKDAVAAYQTGDAEVADIINNQAAYLAKAMAISSNLLNVEAIIIGGYVVQFGGSYLKQVKKVFNEHIIRFYRNKVHIKYGRLGRDAVGIGGAALVLKKLWDMEII